MHTWGVQGAAARSPGARSAVVMVTEAAEVVMWLWEEGGTPGGQCYGLGSRLACPS